MSEWTRARHPEAGEAIVPVGALPHMPYWEAFGEPGTQQELLMQIDQERADAAEAEEARVAEASQAAEDGRAVAEVLEAVGDDPAAAAAALEAEKAKPTKDQRKTLVGQLEEIAHSAPEDPDQAAASAATVKD